MNVLVQLFIIGHLTFVKGHRGEWRTGYSYPEITPQEIMVDTVNYVGLVLLNAHNHNNNNNIALSPYGATTVLVALSEGLQGRALDEILDAALLPQEPDLMRIGLRDIHRHLKSYFIPQEGFLAGLTFSHDNVTLRKQYENILKFYGFDVDAFNSAFYPGSTTSFITTTTSSSPTDHAAFPETTSVNSTEMLNNTTTSEMEETTIPQHTTTTVTSDTASLLTIGNEVHESTTTTNNINGSTTNTVTIALSSTTTVVPAESSTFSVTATTSTNVADLTSALPLINEEEKKDKITSKQSTNTVTKTSISSATTNAPKSSTEIFNSTTELPSTSTRVTLPSTMQTLTSIFTTLMESQAPRETTTTQITDPIEFSLYSSTINTETTTDTVTPLFNTASTTDAISTSATTSTTLETSGDNLETTYFLMTTSKLQTEFTNNSTDNETEIHTTDTIVSTEKSAPEEMLRKKRNYSFNLPVTIKLKTVAHKTKRTNRTPSDYLIAKYHDSSAPSHIISRYEPVKPKAFLIKGTIFEPNVSFMTYDTVLPYRYISYLNALAISFPLDSAKYYLLLLLPIDETGIDNLIDNIMSTTLKQIIYNLQPTRVKATIPSFILKGFVVLTPTLRKLGIRSIFEPNCANFYKMTDAENIYVTNIEQAITVTIKNFVNTTNTYNNEIYQRRGPVVFNADHPFLYFVMDSEIHVALMAGKIVNPVSPRIT